MRDQHFGIEMEMTGITRKHASEIIAKHFHAESEYEGGTYGAYAIRDQEGRKWRVVSDSSIERQTAGRRSANIEYSVEVVSPICEYKDIDDIQQIVRDLRRNHAIVNDSCGIHVHVDASKHTPRTLRNIANIMYAKEDLLYKALQIEVNREHYCKKMEESFMREINQRKPRTMGQMKDIWYRENPDSLHNFRGAHYDQSRYHGLNLHSVFDKGTVEFRLFNGTLHAGEIKSYIQLCLAISNQALIQKRASNRKTQSSNERYTFRTWLLRLGLIGDEFKTARKHLLKHLDGCIAWKDPAQAEAQKLRLQKKRDEEQAVRHEEETMIEQNDEQGMEFIMQRR